MSDGDVGTCDILVLVVWNLLGALKSLIASSGL